MAYFKRIVFSFLILLLAIISLDEARADDAKIDLRSAATKTNKFHCQGNQSKIKCRLAHLGRDSLRSSDGKPYEVIEDTQIHSSRSDHDSSPPSCQGPNKFKCGQLRSPMGTEDDEKDEKIDAESDADSKAKDEKDKNPKEKDGKEKKKEKDGKKKVKDRCKGKDKKKCKEKGFEEPEEDISREAMGKNRIPCNGENKKNCRPGGWSDACKGKNKKNCPPGRKSEYEEEKEEEEKEKEEEEKEKKEEEREEKEEESKEDGGNDSETTTTGNDAEKKIRKTKCKGKNNANCYKGMKQSRKLFPVLDIDEEYDDVAHTHSKFVFKVAN